MPKKKLLGAAALSAALAGGALLATPGVAFAHGGGGFGGSRGGPIDLDVAAEALGITEDELEDALEDDQSIADVAAARNVNVQAVVDALVADANARIDDEVADGDLDAEDAAELKEDVTDRVEDRIDDDFGGGRPGRGFGGGRRGFGGRLFDLDVAAEALGISDDELEDALEDDQSIADVAAARNVNVQTVVDALVADADAEIDEAVADGDLDAEDAAELKEDVTDRVEDLVDNDGGFGRRGFGRR